jgi:hypothetical protein
MRNTIFAVALIGGAAGCVAPQSPSAWGPPAVAGQPGAAATADGSAPAADPAPVEPGACEAACSQLAACGMTRYEDCLAPCAGIDPAQLAVIAQTSCEALAAAAPPAEPPGPADGAPPGPGPDTAPSAAAGATALAGRWTSTEWATVTNPAFAGADLYLAITVDGDGRFTGSWAHYTCLAQAYGILSCSLMPIQGSVSGRLTGDGGGAIELARLGRSALTWQLTPGGELAIGLPPDWQAIACCSGPS